jgi:hypothetical protein
MKSYAFFKSRADERLEYYVPEKLEKVNLYNPDDRRQDPYWRGDRPEKDGDLAIYGNGENLSLVNKNQKKVEFSTQINNAVMRLLIWTDMIGEILKPKPILGYVFGFDFGKPFRSKTIEALNWGWSDWHTDGWISAHNSYLHYVYRAGVFGFCIIAFLLSPKGRIPRACPWMNVEEPI